MGRNILCIEKSKKSECPKCLKMVDRLELVIDQYGIPYKYCCSECVGRVKAEIRPNYNEPDY